MKKMIFDSMVKNAVKWVLPFCLFAFLPLTVSAQDVATDGNTLKYGYLSYDAVLHSMNEYATVETSMMQLNEKYAAEQKRAEDEFNRKYEEFLDTQRDMPQTILQKRQSELQVRHSWNRQKPRQRHLFASVLPKPWVVSA